VPLYYHNVCPSEGQASSGLARIPDPPILRRIQAGKAEAGTLGHLGQELGKNLSQGPVTFPIFLAIYWPKCTKKQKQNQNDHRYIEHLGIISRNNLANH
jgi:hypothetical protein